MTKLELCRNEIDLIDEEIIRLYEKRMEIVKEVINYKLDNNIEILDSSREEKMLNENLAIISKEEYKKYYKDVLTGFLKASKEMQKDILDAKKDN